MPMGGVILCLQGGTATCRWVVSSCAYKVGQQHADGWCHLVSTRWDSNMQIGGVMYYILMCGESLSFLSDPPLHAILCGTMFCKLAPKFICTIREGSIHFINVRNSKRKSYQCLQNKNPLSSCKVSTFFHFVSFSDDPFPAPTFYWRALWLLWRHTTPTAAQTFCMLFMNQIDFKMHINEQIIIKLYGELEYECIMRWLSNGLVTDTWKVGHGKHSYFLSMRAWWMVGCGKGVGEKTEGGP